jgi:DNA-binding response OmpR family regulator
LGECDGLDLIKTVQAEQPRARVVVMSGGGARLNASYCLNLAGAFGADEQLRKPFSYSELLAAVEGSSVSTDAWPIGVAN